MAYVMRDNFQRWLIMVCLCVSGGVIYMMPYLREFYYIPLQQALDLSNIQMGKLSSVYGVTAMLAYVPGGILADRVNFRALLTFSLVVTGIAGLFFATFPPFHMSMAVSVVWGISTILTFWAALIKATRIWAPAAEQGRAFGILESGRGVVTALGATVHVALFAALGSGALGLSWVLRGISGLCIAFGLLVWFAMKNSADEKNDRKQDTDSRSVELLREALKTPAIWLIACVVLAAYTAKVGGFRFTDYAIQGFGLSVSTAAALGVSKLYIGLGAAFVGGVLADKLGTSKVSSIFFVVMTLGFGMFAIVTPETLGTVMMVAHVLIISAAVFVLRGIYYALFEQCSVSLGVTGAAVGTVSIIGYTPDIFMPMLTGHLLDAYPGTLGYRYVFAFVAGICALGLCASVAIMRGKAIPHRSLGRT